MSVILALGCLGVAVIAISLFAMIILLKKVKKRSKIQTHTTLTNKSIVVTSRDIRAIAGEDMMVTQLDLARAYVELGKIKLAKQILNHVILHGNSLHQQSAQRLLSNL